MAHSKQTATKKWSGKVTRTSHVLELEKNIFEWKDPHRIALSLKRSAEKSSERKTTPFRSAMSMLNFYINRAGTNLNSSQKDILEKRKEELRIVFGKKKIHENQG